MSGAAGTLVGAVFLATLRARQPLTARQIRAAVSTSSTSRHAPKYLTSAIEQCVSQGYVLKHPQPGRHPTYSVTPACSAPHGIRIADVLEAVQP